MECLDRRNRNASVTWVHRRCLTDWVKRKGTKRDLVGERDDEVTGEWFVEGVETSECSKTGRSEREDSDEGDVRPSNEMRVE